MFWIVTCAALLSLSSAKLLSITDCGGSYGTIHSMDLTPCEGNIRGCQVTPGQRYTAHINFTAHEDTRTATNSVHGQILGVWEQWGGMAPNVCGNGMRCPVTAGLAQTYVASAVCPATNPKRLVAKWEVLNDQGHAFICAVFPILVV